MFFFKNHTENEAKRPVPGLFVFQRNTNSEVNASGLLLSFNQFR